MANSSNSPVLDGIWFRPYLGTARNDDVGMTTDSSSTGNTIPPTAKSISVEGVETDANDWITLPSLADVPNGHQMLIFANASSNFELRTPSGDNEKINNVDSDSSAEYLVTDTDMVIITKRNNTDGWVAQSITNLGAVRTAVVPD